VVVLVLLLEIIHLMELDSLVVLAGEPDQIVLEQLVVLETLVDTLHQKETLAVPPVDLVVAVVVELVELVSKENPKDQELVVMDLPHPSLEHQ